MKRPPAFAMMIESTFKRLPAAQQDELFWQAREWAPDLVTPSMSNRNAKERWATIRIFKAAFWDRNAGTSFEIKPARDPQATANVNAVFDTFPPLPEYGEDCTCALCQTAPPLSATLRAKSPDGGRSPSEEGDL